MERKAVPKPDDTRPETLSFSNLESTASAAGAVKGAATYGEMTRCLTISADAELARLADLWPSLSDGVRQSLVALAVSASR
jgi:hypothetical protein